MYVPPAPEAVNVVVPPTFTAASAALAVGALGAVPAMVAVTSELAVHELMSLVTNKVYVVEEEGESVVEASEEVHDEVLEDQS